MTATAAAFRAPLDHLAPGATPTPGSLLAKLQDAATRQRVERHLELDVPGAFQGMMRVRYHGLPLDGLERYADLLATGRTTNLSTVLDMLATCCEAVLGLDPETGEWQTLTDELGPVGLDDRLARLLKLPRFDAETELSTREVIEGLFMPGGNSVPLGNHAGELATWLSDTEGLDPGESSAGSGSLLSAEPPPSA